MQRKTPQLVADLHLLFEWRPVLDARLYRAAERLVEAGCVSEVRVHQNGSIGTGIVRTEELAARHRIYIRRVNGPTPMQAEWYPSVNPRLSREAGVGDTLRHVLTQECADDEESTFTFETPGRHPSLVGRTSGGPA